GYESTPYRSCNRVILLPGGTGPEDPHSPEYPILHTFHWLYARTAMESRSCKSRILRLLVGRHQHPYRREGEPQAGKESPVPRRSAASVQSVFGLEVASYQTP